MVAAGFWSDLAAGLAAGDLSLAGMGSGLAVGSVDFMPASTHLTMPSKVDSPMPSIMMRSATLVMGRLAMILADLDSPMPGMERRSFGSPELTRARSLDCWDGESLAASFSPWARRVLSEGESSSAAGFLVVASLVVLVESAAASLVVLAAESAAFLVESAIFSGVGAAGLAVGLEDFS